MDKSDHAKQMLEIQEQQLSHAESTLKKDYTTNNKELGRDIAITMELNQKYIDGLDEILDHIATEGLK